MVVVLSGLVDSPADMDYMGGCSVSFHWHQLTVVAEVARVRLPVFERRALVRPQQVV